MRVIRRWARSGRPFFAALYRGARLWTVRALPVAQAILIPLGVVVLFYWASQERSMRLHTGEPRFLILGVLVSQLSFYVFALRFRRALCIVGLNLGVADALRISMVSMFYHFFVPFSVGAEITKYVKLRALAPARRAVVMVGGIVIDHAIGFVVLIALLGVVTGLVAPVVAGLELRVPVVAGVACLLIAAVVVARSPIAARPAVARHLRALHAHQTDAACAFVWAVVAQLLIALAVFAGSAAWGMPIDYGEVLFVLTAAFVLQGAPLNLAGVGVADLAGTGFYLALGLPLADAVLLVSLLYCYRIQIAVVGAVWELIAARRGAAAAES